MKINKEGLDIDVMFMRRQVTGITGTDSKDRTMTLCRISKILDLNKKGKDNYKMLFEGHSVCHPKDKDCKAMGYKMALTKALAKCLDKNLRATIWSEFLKVYQSKLAKA